MQRLTTEYTIITSKVHVGLATTIIMKETAIRDDDIVLYYILVSV